MRIDNLLRQASRSAGGWLHRLLPVLLPLLVFGIALLLLDSARDSGFKLNLAVLELDPPEQGPSAEQMARTTEIRFAWATAMLVLGTAIVVTIVVAFEMSVRTLGAIPPVAAGLIGSAIGGWFFVARDKQDLTIMPWSADLFRELDCVGERWFGGGIYSWIGTNSIIEALVFPLIFLVGLSFSGLLWTVRREEPSGEVRSLTIDDLRVRRQMAATLLNCSALVLVSFLVEFYTILRWPVVVVAKPEPVIAMASGVTAWVGVLFTLILATMAIPVIMGLSRRAGESAMT